MKNGKKENIYIIICAYNEEEKVEKVVSKLKKFKIPIIVVNDASEDQTLTKTKKADFVLSHKLNLGKGSAMRTGCEFAFERGARAVVFLDADGQHDPEDLPKFFMAINKGYDLVFGSRNLSHGVPLVRYLGNKLGSVLVSLLYGIYVSDLLCGYRAITKDAYKKIKWESMKYGVETEMVIRTAKTELKYCEVPVSTLYFDEYKGVTLLDAINVFFDVFRWKYIK